MLPLPVAHPDRRWLALLIEAVSALVVVGLLAWAAADRGAYGFALVLTCMGALLLAIYREALAAPSGEG